MPATGFNQRTIDEFQRNKVANVVDVRWRSDASGAILLFGVGLNRVSPPTRDKALLLKKFQPRNRSYELPVAPIANPRPPGAAIIVHKVLIKQGRG